MIFLKFKVRKNCNRHFRVKLFLSVLKNLFSIICILTLECTIVLIFIDEWRKKYIMKGIWEVESTKEIVVKRIEKKEPQTPKEKNSGKER